VSWTEDQHGYPARASTPQPSGDADHVAAAPRITGAHHGTTGYQHELIDILTELRGRRLRQQRPPAHCPRARRLER
jgi:hypothetical protein